MSVQYEGRFFGDGLQPVKRNSKYRCFKLQSLMNFDLLNQINILITFKTLNTFIKSITKMPYTIVLRLASRIQLQLNPQALVERSLEQVSKQSPRRFIGQGLARGRAKQQQGGFGGAGFYLMPHALTTEVLQCLFDVGRLPRQTGGGRFDQRLSCDVISQKGLVIGAMIAAP